MKFRRKSRFSSSSSGSTIVEFALIAPILLMIIFSTVEFGLIIFAGTLLDSAATEGARLGKTGSAYNADNRDEAIRGYINEHGRPFLNSSNLRIQATTFSSITAAGITGVTANPADFGTSGEVVAYTLLYDWKVVSPFLLLFSENGNYTISSTTLVKNEPF